MDPVVAGERIAELLEFSDGSNALLVDGAHGLFRRVMASVTQTRHRQNYLVLRRSRINVVIVAHASTRMTAAPPTS
jgi:hypothetical protein